MNVIESTLRSSVGFSLFHFGEGIVERKKRIDGVVNEAGPEIVNI